MHQRANGVSNLPKDVWHAAWSLGSNHRPGKWLTCSGRSELHPGHTCFCWGWRWSIRTQSPKSTFIYRCNLPPARSDQFKYKVRKRKVKLDSWIPVTRTGSSRNSGMWWWAEFHWFYRNVSIVESRHEVFADFKITHDWVSAVSSHVGFMSLSPYFMQVTHSHHLISAVCSSAASRWRTASASWDFSCGTSTTLWYLFATAHMWRKRAAGYNHMNVSVIECYRDKEKSF